MNVRFPYYYVCAGCVWLFLAFMAFMHWTPFCPGIIGTHFAVLFLNIWPLFYALFFTNRPYPHSAVRFTLVFIALIAAGGLASLYLHIEIKSGDLAQNCNIGPLPPPPPDELY